MPLKLILRSMSATAVKTVRFLHRQLVGSLLIFQKSQFYPCPLGELGVVNILSPLQPHHRFFLTAGSTILSIRSLLLQQNPYLSHSSPYRLWKHRLPQKKEKKRKSRPHGLRSTCPRGLCSLPAGASAAAAHARALPAGARPRGSQRDLPPASSRVPAKTSLARPRPGAPHAGTGGRADLARRRRPPHSSPLQPTQAAAAAQSATEEKPLRRPCLGCHGSQ